MSKRRALVGLLIALASGSATRSEAAAQAQPVAAPPQRDDLEREVAAMKAENAALRERCRELEAGG